MAANLKWRVISLSYSVIGACLPVEIDKLEEVASCSSRFPLVNLGRPHLVSICMNDAEDFIKEVVAKYRRSKK